MRYTKLARYHKPTCCGCCGLGLAVVVARRQEEMPREQAGGRVVGRLRQPLPESPGPPGEFVSLRWRLSVATAGRGLQSQVSERLPPPVGRWLNHCMGHTAEELFEGETF